ncbi:kinase-like domain-containing protein [Amanita rubescens]|nr:kinase-like domain-containing protein [Amanita rubescens]
MPEASGMVYRDISPPDNLHKQLHVGGLDRHTRGCFHLIIQSQIADCTSEGLGRSLDVGARGGGVALLFLSHLAVGKLVYLAAASVIFFAPTRHTHSQVQPEEDSNVTYRNKIPPESYILERVVISAKDKLDQKFANIENAEDIVEKYSSDPNGDENSNLTKLLNWCWRQGTFEKIRRLKILRPMSEPEHQGQTLWEKRKRSLGVQLPAQYHHPSLLLSKTMSLSILPSLDDDEYESDEYPELKPNLTGLSDLVHTRIGRTITSCQKVTRGTYHEIYMLNTEDGRKLIARLCRSLRHPSALRSEVATMTLVRLRTSIPVPVVHFFEDSPSNEVGMQYLVMDYVEGVNLYQIWDDLTLEHKKDVLTQIAWVLGQLANMEFEATGSITEDGSVGPLLHHMMENINGQEVIEDMSDGPFGSMFDYLNLFIDRFSSSSSISGENRMLLYKVRDILENYFASHKNEPYIRPPFRLRHTDFDGQNLLFTDPTVSGGTSPPRLVGVIDWDHAHTAPLYFLYEYPVFIQDVDTSKNLYEENAILRPHFVRAIRKQFPPGTARYFEAQACIPSGRCSTLNNFKAIFMNRILWSNKMMQGRLERYVATEEAGTGKAYADGRVDWVPDSDESDSDEGIRKLH